MVSTLASILVLLLGLYLVALGVLSLLLPARAERFLGGFAGSAAAHYLELVLRLIAGWAVLVYAPHMLFPGAFAIVGWVLVATTVGLLAVPWRWHQRFALWAVPHATAHLRLVALSSFVFGSVVITSVILGGATEP